MIKHKTITVSMYYVNEDKLPYFNEEESTISFKVSKLIGMDSLTQANVQECINSANFNAKALVYSEDDLKRGLRREYVKPLTNGFEEYDAEYFRHIYVLTLPVKLRRKRNKK